MLQSLLEILPSVAAFEAVRDEWRDRIGAACLDRLPPGYLANTRTLATTVPCRNRRSCRRHHVVEEKADGRLVAYCQADEDCRAFEVAHEDRVIWRLDLPSMFADFAETLSLDASPECLSAGLWRLGTYTKRRIPVFLGFADRLDGHIRDAAVVSAQRHSSFVFFVPDGRTVSQPLRDAVSVASGRLGSLTDFLTVDRRRRLVATQELGDIWSDLAKEPSAAVVPLRVPPGTSWADIVVQVADRETIRISTRAGGESKTYTRDGLGLGNQRSKTQRAKQVWNFLLGLAERSPDGIERPEKQEDRDDLNNRVRELNRLLSRLVDGVPDESPIRLSRKPTDRRYRWAFKLSSKI